MYDSYHLITSSLLATHVVTHDTIFQSTMFPLACNIHALCYLLYAKHVANMCRTVTQVTPTCVIIIIICMVGMLCM